MTIWPAYLNDVIMMVANILVPSEIIMNHITQYTYCVIAITGVILGLCLANERCYKVTLSLIGWAQT